MGLFFVLPMAVVFVEAFARGVWPYLANFADPDVVASIELTLLVAAITVPLNALFGVSAAWAIAKFSFPGQSAAGDPDRFAVLGLARDRRA